MKDYTSFLFCKINFLKLYTFLWGGGAHINYDNIPIIYPYELVEIIIILLIVILTRII